MQTLKFTKMQGLGNDFIIIKEKELPESCNRNNLAIKLCDRRLGIGADGLIILQGKAIDTDFEWDFYNSDGTIAEMCGNGMRCFAKYLVENNITEKKEFSVKTLAGTIIPKVNNDGTITVNMGNPIFTPEKVPVQSENTPVLNEKLEVQNKEFSFNAISMGNPHCIIFESGAPKEFALQYGYDIEHHPLFPKKTNVEFVKVLSQNEITIDVWERGCGITQACGTGACASVTACILNNLTSNKVKANLPGGALTIEWQGSKDNLAQPVFMTGNAEFVFYGEVLL